nr:MAG TPA: hypothetical protein [Bacteriophage sp.]
MSTSRAHGGPLWSTSTRMTRSLCCSQTAASGRRSAAPTRWAAR